jgi:hypothetical protein
MCKQKSSIEGAIFVDLNKPEKVSLFDYFDSIELIPLETSDEILIMGIPKIIVHQDKYYAFDIQQNIIFVFDQTGKYLYRIDKKGQGSGEYTFINDFNVNPFSGNLELLEPYGRVLIYDLSGNYIETKRVVYPDFRAVHEFAILDNHTHVFYAMFEPKKIIYFNLDEQKLLHIEFEEDRELGAFATKNLYQFQDDWYFFRPIHPVVYRLGQEGIEVTFQFDFGNYTRQGRTANFSQESRRDFSRKIEELFAQFPYLIQAVRHNSRYVFASVSLNDLNHWANIIYDKTTGEAKFILEFTEQVLFNSHRGEEIIVTDEYVLMSIQWGDLEKRITKEMLDDKNKETFEKLLGAPEELNPVLIKYRFR